MKIYKIFLSALVSAIASISVTSASAGLITGVTATTNMGSGFGTNIQNTVNGVGLSSLALNATHAGTIPTNSWVSSGTLTGLITFDLGGTFILDGFSFWNQNGGGPGASGTTGLNGVDVLFSTDGVNFNPWFSGTFAQVPNISALAPELFNPVDVTANYVRFNVLSNWGDGSQSGFAEVQFDGTRAVPEPTTMALVGLALAGLGLSRRRRV